MDSILVWFRRDLRDGDQAALCEALRRARSVHCAFIFDREIIDPLRQTADRRVEFIHGSLLELDHASNSTTRCGRAAARWSSGMVGRATKYLGWRANSV
ncbi:MAG: deoxyribodipyrimidine photo-lyase, 8-HDF type [Candidatus Accumulibacter sp. BA-94]|nr:MAG: deoxyribodipyrimidine photo-lyase, 8-HDF type [Candidatus Accumulibacter sp. BA-94]